MKLTTIITVDMETGEYDLEFQMPKKEDKVDQKEIVKVLSKVLENWNQKFLD